MKKEAKKALTQEITSWLQNEVNNSTDPIIKATFGAKDYISGDYFHNADSLRLRSAGYHLLKQYFDYEEFEHDRLFYVGEILVLSQKMNAPFFINQNKIVLFHQEHIVMCKMAGSVAHWLKNFS